MNLIEQIKRDEGFRSLAYRCSEGVLTIAYGRNIDPDHGGGGISELEGGMMLSNDLRLVEDDLDELFPNWESIDQVRKNALLNMRFQLGADGIRKFRRMVRAVKRGRWDVAAREALDSQWAEQTPRRAHRVAREIRGGISFP